jgi:DNA polymerase III epsilon subunit-like protein
MITSSTLNFKTPLFFYDCEVDHKDLELANITEICVSENNPKPRRGDKPAEYPYFVGYIKKPDCANYASPYQKPCVGQRYPLETVLNKIISFINKKTEGKPQFALMGYNVEGWDAPVLLRNCEGLALKDKIAQWKWIDLAKIAQHLGYEKGTTQQQLEVAVCAERLPYNRHRAFADVKVVKEIWRKMTEKLQDNALALYRLDEAFAGEQPEENIAKILLEYDPSLAATEEAKQVIRNIKEAEKLARKEVVVLFDLETTGLFQEEQKGNTQHYNKAPRIVEFAAKVLSPFKEEEYQQEVFETLVNPGSEIPAEATAVHQISTDMVKDCPTMGKVWDLFQKWIRTTKTFQKILEEATGEDVIEPRIILVGYNNNRYDNKLLEGELLNAKIDLKRAMNSFVMQSWDAMPLMSSWYAGLSKDKRPEDNKLQTHAAFLDIDPGQAHRALDDVLTLEKILRTIMGEVDPASIIVEAVKEKIHFSRPGAGFKEIIQEAQALIQANTGQLDAIKQAIVNYLMPNEEEEEKIERPSKRARKAPKIEMPDTQEFLVPTQEEACVTPQTFV